MPAAERVSERTPSAQAEARALASGGTSADAIYRLVSKAIERRAPAGGAILDLGCGKGLLRNYLPANFTQYTGMDLVRYEGFPGECMFHLADFNVPPYSLSDASMDLVAAVEVIEHLENPRAFVRELARLARPGGLVIVTTPNQLSLLSKMTLLVKNQFNAFQDSCYPAHLTALLESDLRRIFLENGLEEITVEYSNSGRIPWIARHCPKNLGFRGRAFSDNVLIAGRK